MLKYLKSEKGSTLAMLLIVITILITLGVAILSATAAGFRFKVMDNRQKTAFYISEAGLEEAYAYLGEEVENAMNYARQVYVPRMLETTSTDLIGGVIEERTPKQKQTLEEKQFRELQNTYFKAGYREYFIVNRTTIQGNLRGGLGVLNKLSGQHGEKIHEISCDVAMGFVSDQLLITFKTKVYRVLLNGSKTPASEQIDTVIAVGVPESNTPFIKQKTQYEIKRNALWDKALAADGNIYVMGGPVTVAGNVYAHGSNGTAVFADKQNTGGIIVGGINDRTAATAQSTSGTLTVNGEVATNLYLQTRYSSNGQPSSIDIAGPVYCNSLITQRGTSTANENSRIKITGDVTILDDTELNALKSKININGSYFGFSTGNTANHDSSSSLVVNTEDLSTGGSELEITGSGLSRTWDINWGTPQTVTAPSGVYLSGTVYIDEEKDYEMVTNGVHGTVTLSPQGQWIYKKNNIVPEGVTEDTFQYRYRKANDPDHTVYGPFITTVDLSGNLSGRLNQDYQTGDSVSIKGNYMGYGEVLTGAGVEENYKNIPAANFKEYWPLTLVEKLKDGASMGALEKSTYSKYAKDELSYLYQFGNNHLLLDKDRVKYAQGTILGYAGSPGSEVWDLFFDKDSSVHKDPPADQLLCLQKDYLYQTQWAGDPQETNYINLGTDQFDTRPLSQWLNPSWSHTIIDSSPGTDFSVAYADSSESGEDDVLILLGDGVEETDLAVEILKAKSKDPVVIDISGGTEDDPLGGIILGNTDVYVLGEVYYQGLIMAQGDIWCLGNDPKSFTNQNIGTEDNYVINRVFNDIAIHPGTNLLGNVFEQSMAWTLKVEKLFDTINVEDGLNLSYSGSMGGIIQITDWKRTNNLTE